MKYEDMTLIEYGQLANFINQSLVNRIKADPETFYSSIKKEAYKSVVATAKKVGVKIPKGMFNRAINDYYVEHYPEIIFSVEQVRKTTPKSSRDLTEILDDLVKQNKISKLWHSKNTK